MRIDEFGKFKFMKLLYSRYVWPVAGAHLFKSMASGYTENDPIFAILSFQLMC